MYYIRAHGEISGPYTVGKLKNMQQSGEFSSAYEVSTDQREWQPASTLIKSFRTKRTPRKSPGPATPPEVKSVIEEPRSQKHRREQFFLDDDQWHYSQAGRQSPTVITYSELTQMLHKGVLTGEDHVIQKGMSTWVKISEHPELRLHLGTESVSVDAETHGWISASSGSIAMILSVVTMILFVTRLRNGGFVPSNNMPVFFLGLMALFFAVVGIFVGHSILANLRQRSVPAKVGRLVIVGLTGGYTTVITEIILSIILVVHLVNPASS